jgi:hypothetical protein
MDDAVFKETERITAMISKNRIVISMKQYNFTIFFKKEN